MKLRKETLAGGRNDRVRWNVSIRITKTAAGRQSASAVLRLHLSRTIHFRQVSFGRESELVNQLAVLSVTEMLKSFLVDVLADEADRTITHSELCSAGM